MTIFKIIDCGVQLLLIAIGFFVGIIGKLDYGEYNFMICYLGVGAWQLLSVFVHWNYQKEEILPLRNLYYRLLIGTVMFGVTISIFMMGYIFLIGLLLWSPLLALLYLTACLQETTLVAVPAADQGIMDVNQ